LARLAQFKGMRRRLGRHVVEVQHPWIFRGLPRHTDLVQVGLLCRRLLAGNSPPLAAGLAGPRGHRVEQDQEVDGHPFAHQWRREADHRLGDQNQVGAIADRVDDRFGVLGPAGGIIRGGQRDGHGLVAEPLELGHEAMLVPGAAAGAGDQDVGCHAL
jgi:hypothetical protein